jgi:hypothetical protein
MWLWFTRKAAHADAEPWCRFQYSVIACEDTRVTYLILRITLSAHPVKLDSGG